ncbi:hypothetical protein FD04_GL001377 [Secundilactobacillus odoratitofui DSM 19909 = JCM 15043]|uniref:Uncharacterized protein n=1 Tax=Secundilactobacillus odoratitofui DSM 19909 = JCM 15043 TaxID=1423776 RepID=A0A0R1LNL6_9LACO|nr:hypothetical protein [Secundilactobacillus odoratitofui]KRK97359.1 hypothetical protein FD04_GL001377 [Secundilactobacillus odoratitofui DSM 19909 = JCM 15043]
MFWLFLLWVIGVILIVLFGAVIQFKLMGAQKAQFPDTDKQSARMLAQRQANYWSESSTVALRSNNRFVLSLALSMICFGILLGVMMCVKLLGFDNVLEGSASNMFEAVCWGLIALGVALIWTSIVRQSDLKKQTVFWQHYLTTHEQNELQVILPSAQLSRARTVWHRTFEIFSGVTIFLLLIIFNVIMW